MDSFSILYFDKPKQDKVQIRQSYQTLKDVGLDKIIKDISNTNRFYNIERYFLEPLDLENINYRLEVFKDLENEEILNCILDFADGMLEYQRKIKQLMKVYVSEQRHWYFTSLIIYYTDLIESFYNRLSRLEPESRALKKTLEVFGEIIETQHYPWLKEKAQNLLEEVGKVGFNLRLKGDQVEVTPLNNTSDYSIEIENTFKNFRRGKVNDYIYRQFSNDYRMNDLEEEILKGVKSFYPKPFKDLAKFYRDQQNFESELINDFYEELQFYLTYLTYIQPIKNDGLSFSIPEFNESKEVNIVDGFDINLIYKQYEHSVIPNSFKSYPENPIFIITGANQGGKTTFTKTIAQIFYLASVGVPVPAKTAQVFLVDRILTHFEKEESIYTGNGKLMDDLVRVKDILDHSTSRSLIILNEIFSSTTMTDALSLSKEILKQIKEIGSICLFVTFLDDLLAEDEEFISLVAQVDEQNERIYKIIPENANGQAYADTIAQKYNLTYDQIIERINQ